MNSFRKWFYRPRRDDPSLLAQFYYSDEELNLVAGELDSFDGRKDPERCTALVNQLRQCQDRVLSICVDMMDDLLPDEREPRDFRVKFPDDVMQENLAGQLWFGAECLAAGSSILNRETESTRMRPLAKAVTKTIENVRNLLREQCLKPIPEYTEKIRESLKILDRLFADFELSYVSAMVPVKTPDEHQRQQYVVVLFSETLQRALKISLINQEQIDNYDPALMFTIPRLAIVSGLLLFPDGPLSLDKDAKGLSELFRPFKTLLVKIRELLWTLSARELVTLEKCLCSMEEPNISEDLTTEVPDVIPDECVEQTSAGYSSKPLGFNADFVNRFYTNYPSCRLTTDLSNICLLGKKEMEVSDRPERSKRERSSIKSGSRARARQERQNERFLYRLTGESQHRTKRRTKRSHSHTHSLRQFQAGWPGGQYIPHGASNCHPSHYRQSGYAYSTRHNSGTYTSSRSSDWSHGTSRHERVSTVICGCGSATPHTVEDHQSQRCGRRRKPPNHIIRGSNRVPPPREHLNQYVPEEDHYRESPYHNNCPTEAGSTDYTGSRDELISSGTSANLQNSLRDVVLDDPALLSPSAFCEPDTLQDGAQTNTRDDVQPDIGRLSISGNPYREGSTGIPDWVASSEIPEQDYDRAHGVSLRGSSSAHDDLPVPIERNISTSLRPYGQNDAVSDGSSLEKSHCDGLKKSEDISSGSTSPGQQSFGTSDDEEVALALQAAEVQCAWIPRTSRFSSSGDLIHKLFVCISGVADQLQTNYASDLRKILKSVFLMNETVDEEEEESEEGSHFHEDGNNDSEHLSVESAEDALIGFGSPEQGRSISPDEVEDLPDEDEDDDDDDDHQVRYSVTVPPSVFHDHSLMQYSNMSPPLFPSDSFLATNSDSVDVPHAHESPEEESESVALAIDVEDFEHVDALDSFRSQSPTSPSSVDGSRDNGSRTPMVSEPPLWVPDHLAPRCMACGAGFTVIRRRHHCRNCGKVFCGQCSRHNVPLPHFGVWQNVRVCNACFLYYVTSSADGSAALGS